ncbi:hypothetical protein [Nocardioides sp. LHG3406-4]|uniref:hypothetical protein n=1 Tax=Nocardioides sp. LHG3406-4 TaxID=2804575 RepID=UPI003CE985BC
MRIVRALIALFVAVLIGSSALPAGATGSLPERVITHDTQPKTYKSFKLTGNIEAYPNGKALVQKKKCRGCDFKTVDKITTSAYGNYSTKIYAPLKGKWKWRIKVNEQGGYAASYSDVIATFVK